MSDEPEQAREVQAVESVRETFSGPALEFTLSDDPDPSTVDVTGPDGEYVRVDVDGRTVMRDFGHFGRGRWTVTYLTA